MSSTANNSISSRLIARFSDLFLSHPASVDESYFEHQRVALGFALTLSLIAAAAFLHALIPGLCQSTARRHIATLHERLQARAAR
jgi:hypothetical protein